jgi:ribose transport system substrate-binding protein
MKSVNLFCLLLAMIAATTSCTKQDNAQIDPQTNPPEASTKPKVALVMKSLANEFFSTMAEGAIKHQTEHADQYELIVNGIKDERDIARQAALVDEMVAAGVKAIVIAPADSKALVPALRRAQKAGVVIVNIDNKLDPDLIAQEQLTIPFVGPDNRIGAKKAGDYLATKLKAGDNVAVIEGIKTSFNGNERRLGFEDAMKAASINIVSSQSAQWETKQADTLTGSILAEHPDVKAILAANDSMALGAIAAIRAAGLSDKVLVVGFDNIGAAQSAINEGKMLATVDQHADQLAVFGIEFAIEMLKDPSTKLADKQTPVDLVTKQP